MSNIQTAVLNDIRTLAINAGLAIIEQKPYANLGTMLFVLPGKYNSLLSLAYDFQDSSFSVNVYDAGFLPKGGMVSAGKDGCRQSYYIQHNENLKINTLLRHLKYDLINAAKDATPKKATPKVKDDINTPLLKLLTKYQKDAGTDLSGAVRDCMTQLIHICADKQLNAEERWKAAFEVYDEHCELASGT